MFKEDKKTSFMKFTIAAVKPSSFLNLNRLKNATK